MTANYWKLKKAILRRRKHFLTLLWKPVLISNSYLQAIKSKNYYTLTAKNYTDFQLCFPLEQYDKAFLFRL